MSRTGFVPNRNGFHFENTFVNQIVGAIRTYGLCGGMSLAASRYYKRNIPIPFQTVLPRENSTLRDYIYSCQMESYGPFGLLSAVNWITMPAVSFEDQFRWCFGEFDRIKPHINCDNPIVIGLRHRGSPGGHQVLAIGYDEAPRRISVYDPNYPNEERLITMDESSRRLVYSRYNGGEGLDTVWSSFFITGCSIGNQVPPEIRTVQ